VAKADEVAKSRAVDSDSKPPSPESPGNEKLEEPAKDADKQASDAEMTAGTPPEAAADESAPAEPVEAGGNASDESKEKVAAATEPATDAATEPPQTEPPQTEPRQTEPAEPTPPPKNPLADLPPSVDLPDQEDAETFRLGSLDMGATTSLTLTLLGGREVIRDPSRFQLDPARGTEQSWRVLIIGDKENPDREEHVAQVSVREDELTFQWEPNAAQNPLATQLRNCVLRCRSKDHTHDLRLRTPLEMEAMLITLVKPTMSESYRVPDLPNAALLKFQITSLNEPFPPCTLKPAEAIEADGGKVTATLGESVDEQVAALEFETQVRRTLVVKVSALFQLAPGTRPEPMSNSRLETVGGQVMRNQQITFENVQRVRAINQKIGRDDPKKKRAENELKRAEALLDQAAQVTQKYEVLRELRESLKDGGVVHFRLFYSLDDCVVELVKTVNP
jgi:hypothetical protein